MLRDESRKKEKKGGNFPISFYFFSFSTFFVHINYNAYTVDNKIVIST